MRSTDQHIAREFLHDTINVQPAAGEAELCQLARGLISPLADPVVALSAGLDGVLRATIPLAGSKDAMSGAGAVAVTTETTELTTTGTNALTLADGVEGQIKRIVVVSDGGTGTLTPATSTGFTTIAFAALGDSVTLQFYAVLGWMILEASGALPGGVPVSSSSSSSPAPSSSSSSVPSSSSSSVVPSSSSSSPAPSSSSEESSSSSPAPSSSSSSVPSSSSSAAPSSSSSSAAPSSSSSSVPSSSSSLEESSSSSGDVINAASLDPEDVQAALDLAEAGDTVLLPAGTSHWTEGITLVAPPNITVKGAGTSATGGGDQSIIIDDIATGLPVMDFTADATGLFRLTGITIQSGSGATKDGGTVQVSGASAATSSNVRIDHCHFDMTSSANYKAIMFTGGVRGVADHNILDLTGLCAFYFYNGRSSVGEAQGNYEWTQPTAFGTADFFFIEDNIVNGDVASGAYSTRIWDGFTAAKVVVRFNTLVQACISETHATGHAPNDRGTRAQEAYGNAITSSLVHEPNFVMTDLSNGCGLVWGNSADQVFKNIYKFNVTRKAGTSGGGTYNQTATPAGWGYAGTAFNGTGSNWDGGTFNSTDTTLGYPCLDQPGRGAGDLITGNFPSKINDTTGTIAWPNQALEPIYIWNNTGAIVSGWGGSTYSNDSSGRVVADQDYYAQASGIQTTASSPFDGTSGTGWGTLANRPTTCTPGVAYFATDQGSWNTSGSNPYGVQQSGASGVLYVCTATNVWTLYYTPYTYPHPLAA